MSKVSTWVKAAVAGAMVLGFQACGVPDQVTMGYQSKTAPLNDAQSYAVMGAANMGEREMGRAAQAKTLNYEVRQFANKMVTEHRDADMRLDDLAMRTGIYVPDNTRTSEWLTDTTNVNLAYLTSMRSGKDFDREYMDVMIMNHEDLIHILETQVLPGVSSEWKPEVQNVINHTREHLDMARNVRNGL